VLGTRHVDAVPARLALNHWALSGDWTVKPQTTLLNQADGRIVYRFLDPGVHAYAFTFG
jgi:Thioredoxin like C-terminal domain